MQALTRSFPLSISRLKRPNRHQKIASLPALFLFAVIAIYAQSAARSPPLLQVCALMPLNPKT